MSRAVTDPTRPSPQELWEKIRSILADQDAPEIGDTSDIPAIAGMFDTLSVAERSYVAAHMFDELRRILSSDRRFEALHYSILAVVEPYLKRSDLQLESRMLIGRAFRNFADGSRTFDELQALGFALAELEYKVPGAAADWEQFYGQFEKNPDAREDALDVALAGTAASSIAAFSRLIRSVPLDDWAIERLNAYWPTLVKNHAPREVELLLTELDGASAGKAIKAHLKEIAALYELKIHNGADGDSTVRLVSNQALDPPELKYALKLIENELERGVQRNQLIAALDRKTISIIRSNYSGSGPIRQFQIELTELIEKLNGKDNVRPIESAEFVQLPAEISGRRKVIFAFPTYLTATKQDAGYSVCPFGFQQRVGVLYPSMSRFVTYKERPSTLEDLLHEVMRNTGYVWCLKNYAISEIVMQAAASDPEMEAYFSERLVLCDPARPGSSSPLPKPPKAESNFVFIYDLAGHHVISEHVRAQTRQRPSRRGKSSPPTNWLDGARAETVRHDLSVPVGIGFTKYLVRWLLQDNTWDRVNDFVSSWRTKPEFRKALAALGIDQDLPGPHPTDEELPRPRLIAV